MKTYLHSGNAGDVIYMLPTIRANGGGTLYLNPDRPAQYAAGLTHPGGGVMLNENMCNMLLPLVEYCGIRCELWHGEKVDYNLDLFREERINLSAYDIRRWILSVYPELLPGPAFRMERLNNRYITVNLSERYRNNAAGGDAKWAMLQDQPYDVFFIGVQQEFEKFVKLCPRAKPIYIADFLHMANFIAGGMMHFGNQSSPFAVAEIFDLPRVLELSPYCPNVVSTGENWGVVYNNENMKWHVDRLCRMEQNQETPIVINPS
jgi:hypothetical protein